MELPLSQGLAQSPSRCGRHRGLYRRRAETERRNSLVRRRERPIPGITWKAPWGSASPDASGRRRLAYHWMAETQLSDGSWWSATRDGVPEDRTRDSNVSSYIAVGVYHHFLITREIRFLRRLWPTLEAGIDYAVGLQADTGEIHWARNSEGVVDRMALLTGSSSVYMSLKCALAVASLLGKRRSDWESAMKKLGEAIRHRPSLFNMMKARYSMDWYYPVLCGAVTGAEARKRIDRSWEKFVVPEWGVQCVCDQPWVTIAEASELVLTLAAIGESRTGGHRLQLDLRQEI